MSTAEDYGYHEFDYSSEWITGFETALDILERERDRLKRELEGRSEFTTKLSTRLRQTSERLRRFQGAYDRCRRQYKVLNRLHRVAMQRIEILEAERD